MAAGIVRITAISIETERRIMENKEDINNSQQNDEYAMLSESGYSDKAIAYFQNKDNIGVLENPDHVTDLTGPCGDNMKLTMNIEGSKIEDAKFQVLGCPGAVASACAVISLAKGKTLEDAAGLDMDTLYKELEKLPDQKVHCARLALKTLHKAVERYIEKKSEAKCQV